MRTKDTATLLTATGEDLDKIAENICPRRPVPLAPGEDPPPAVDGHALPSGTRWESDQEYRERVMANMMPPRIGSDTTGVVASARPHIVVPDDLPERVVDLEAQMQRMEATILPPDLTGIGTALDALGKRLEGHHVSMDEMEKTIDNHGDYIVKAHCRLDQMAGTVRDMDARFDAWETKMIEEQNRYTRQVSDLVTLLNDHEKDEKNRVTYAVAESNKAVGGANRALELARMNRQAGDAVSADVGKLARAIGALECRVNDLAGPGEPKMDAAMVDMRRELARLAQLGIEHDNSIGEAFDRLNDMKSALRDLTTPEPLSFGTAPTPEPAPFHGEARCNKCGDRIVAWERDIASLEDAAKYVGKLKDSERAADAEITRLRAAVSKNREDIERYKDAAESAEVSAAGAVAGLEAQAAEMIGALQSHEKRLDQHHQTLQKLWTHWAMTPDHPANELKKELDRAISAERAAVAELDRLRVTSLCIPEDLARRVLAWDRAGDMAEGNALILMDAIQRHLREAPTVPEPCDGWIPVGERLPDDGVEVLAWGCWAEDQTEEDWRLWHANYGDGHGGGWWTVGQCREALSPVTHWMPLPPPPKS